MSLNIFDDKIMYPYMEFTHCLILNCCGFKLLDKSRNFNNVKGCKTRFVNPF